MLSNNRSFFVRLKSVALRLLGLVFGILLSFVLTTEAEAAAFTSAATGNWNVGTTWGGACASGCAAGTDFPGASDTAVVSSTYTVTVPTAITANFTSITVQGTATLKLTGQLNGGDLTIKTGATVQQDTTSVQTLSGTLSVESGGTLTHTTNTTAKSYIVYFTMATGSIAGTVSVSSKGYQGGTVASTNGAGTGGGIYVSTGGGGGGYGGNGGNSSASFGGITYGSAIVPDNLGSGGSFGYQSGSNGGAGGGFVQLVATNLTVTGSIVANGQVGTAAGLYYVGGGGSGGGVYLNVSGTFNGSGGTVTANGANGSVQGGFPSGGGAGGRIAISGYTSYTAPTTLTTYGGDRGASTGTSGGSGTIYIKSSSNAGTLTLNNTNRVDGTLSPLPSGQNLDIDEIIVQNGAGFSIPSGSSVTTTQSTFNTPSGVTSTFIIAGIFNPQNATFTFPASTTAAFSGTGTLKTVTNLTINSTSSTFTRGFSNLLTDLTIGSGGKFTMDSFTTSTSALSLTNLTVNGTMTHLANATTLAHSVNISATTVIVGSGGSINVDSLGYRGGLLGSTTGAGPGGAIAGASGAGGGTYGGYGGNGSSSIGPIVTVGSVTAPNDLGSGGGYGGSSGGNGGAGGGLVNIAASTITVSGTISANGQIGTLAGLYYGGGGGSGGGIYLNVSGAFTGTSGTIRANGGAGILGSPYASGGGGGGRISISGYSSYAAPNTFTAYGGVPGAASGAKGGGAGSIFVKSSSNNGTLTFANNDRTDGTMSPASGLIIDEIVIKNGGALSIPAGSSVTTTQSTFNSPSGAASMFYFAGTFNPQNTSFTVPASTTLMLAASADLRVVTSLTINSVSSTIYRGLTHVLSSLTIGTGATFTMDSYTTGTTPLTVATMTINGTVTHTSNTTAQTHIVNLSSTTFVLNSGATIDANYKGYRGGQSGSTTGLGPGGAVYTATGGSGAAYGGAGGNGNGSTGSVVTYGSILGSDYIGSGGSYGGSAGANGGYGGGYVQIAATTMTVAGTISANGQAGTSAATYYTGGGGSGGGIYLNVSGSFNGSGGTITANGGAGVAANVYAGGGGGGGRISIGTLEGAITNVGTITVTGGAKGAAAAQDGSVGTKGSRPDTALSLAASYTNVTLPTNISGTSSYQFNAVSSVNISIQRVSDSQYWNGSAWAAPLAWLEASGTASWTYPFSGVGLTSLESYTVTSRATDSTGILESSHSTAIFAYSADAAPAAPTSPTISSVASTTLSLSWTDNSSGATQETSFVIYRSTDDSTYSSYATVAADTVTTVLTGLTPNTLYYFKVTAVNTDTGSNSSTMVSTTTIAATPTSFAAGSVTVSSVPLTWSASGNAAGTVYEVLNQTTSTWSVTTTTETSYTVSGLLPNESYTFALRALQTSSSPTTYSSEVTVSTTTLPNAPTAPGELVFSSVATSSVMLSWTDHASGADQESSVIIYRSTDDVLYTVYGAYAADTVSASLTSLTPNTTYYFKVTATNVSGSATSTAAATTTIVQAPTVFTGGLVTTSTVPLTWSANSNNGATVYEILNQTTSTWTVASTTATSYSVTGLASNTLYTFALRAVQVGSSPTTYSSEVTFSTTTISSAPPAPSELVFTDVATSTLTLSWTDNSSGGTQETSVVISRSTNGVSYSTIASLAADTITTSITGLNPNQTYYFKVTASNISGSESSTAQSTSTILMAPSTFSSGLTTTSTVPLTWSANGNAAGTVYEVLNQTTSTWTVATTTATSYTVRGLVYDTPYTFGLRAIQNASDPVTYSSELTYSTTTYLEAPVAPSGLVFSSVATSTLSLSWTDNASESEGETSMIVLRSTDDVTFATVATLSANVITTSFSNLTPNTVYYFKVSATNRTGSGVSVSASVSTTVATPISFAAGSVTTSTVPLTWSANGNAATTVYEILNQTTSTWTVATTTATSYTVRGLSSVTLYTFAVRAVQVDSSPTSYSGEATVSATTPMDTPAAPTGLLFSNVATSTLTLSWTDNASAGTQEDSMVVTRSTDGISYSTIATLSADVVTTAVTGLTPNQIYYFKVTATNVSGSGVSSAESTSTMVMVPASFAAGSVTTSTVPLTWSANGNAATTVYEILNQTTSTWTVATTTATSYTVRDLSAVTPYTFGLRAIQANSSPTSYSSEVTVSTTTLTEAPIAPTGLLFSNVATSTLTLSWTDNASAGTQEDSMVVTRSTDGVSYSTIATLSADVVTTAVTGLTPNQIYYFKVTATNTSGSGVSSAESTSTMVMVPASFAAGSVTTSTVPLTWSANGNAATTIYEILNQTTSTWTVATTTATSYTVQDLIAVTPYTFGLRAIQANSSPTSYSSEVTVSTTTLVNSPVAPSGLAFSAVSSTSLVLSWLDNASGGTEESSVVIYRSLNGTLYSAIETLPANTTSTVVSSLTQGTVYYFKVTMLNASGSATSSAGTTSTIAQTDTTPPDVITSFTATVSGMSVALGWVNPVDLDFSTAIIRRSVSGYPASVSLGSAVTSTSGTSFTDTGLEDALYYYSIFSQDVSGNNSAAVHTTALVDTVAVSISGVTSVTTATSSTISWTTDGAASTKVVYSVDESYVSSTIETDLLGDGVTSHEVSIGSLLSCVTYSYKVVSRDLSLNATTSTAGTVTTAGCPGDAAVLSQSNSTISLIGGGTATLGAEDLRVSLVIPTSYASEEASFQLKKLDKTAVLASIGAPANYQVTGGDHVFDFHALSSSAQSAITTFLQPIQVIMYYNAADASSLTESSLTIFRYDDGAWHELSGCAVDTSAKTVTCSTSNFSIFGLFGQVPVVVASVDLGGGAATSFRPEYAKPLGDAVSLAFLINGGSTSTNSRTVQLAFNADPKTVRGYSVSLDSAQRGTSLLSYTSTTYFQLPDVAGTYSVYIRYYSSTGEPSQLLVRTIEYRKKNESAVSMRSRESVASKSTMPLFTRQLKIGDKGEDVRRLQIFLNTHGCSVAKKGAGSPGKETVFFGPALKAAIIRCQQANAAALLAPAKLKRGTGTFGDLMRAWVNKQVSSK